MRIEQIQHFEGRDSLLKQVKENEGMISKKNKGDGAVKKKHQVQLKHPALHPEKHCENQRKIARMFMNTKIKDLDCKK